MLKTWLMAPPTSGPTQLCLGESSPYRPEGRWNTKDSILAHCQTILKRTNQTDRKPTGKGAAFFSLYIGAIWSPFFRVQNQTETGPFWSIDQATQNRQFSTGQTDPKKRPKSDHIQFLEYGHWVGWITVQAVRRTKNPFRHSGAISGLVRPYQIPENGLQNRLVFNTQDQKLYPEV